MREAALERWRPHCVACRAGGRPAPALALRSVARRDGDDIVEGILGCPAAACQREYPIIDGIPILVLDMQAYVEHQLAHITARTDLGPITESLLGDCAGPSSAFESTRYHLAIYGRGHWGDLDPEEPEPRTGSLAGLLGQGLELLPSPPAGSWIDIGCSVGRATFELARLTGQPTLGVDLNFAMLRAARHTARTGRARYGRRRVGLVYGGCDYEVGELARGDVEFWACDATGLAFDDGRFAGALSLNMVDCVPSPVGHLVELGRVVADGGDVVLSSPYDWSESATPTGMWLGGHSQRAAHGGASEAVLRSLLGPEGERGGGMAPALELVGERDDVPWRVAVHGRATMHYRAHLVHARAR